MGEIQGFNFDIVEAEVELDGLGLKRQFGTIAETADKTGESRRVCDSDMMVKGRFVERDEAFRDEGADSIGIQESVVENVLEDLIRKS